MNLLDVLIFPIAYLDPGSGSILIQLIIGAVLGGALAIRAFWGRITARFRGRPEDGGEPEETHRE